MFETTINNVKLCFETEKSVFSPNNIDKGTLATLSTVNLSDSDKVLDLGCGYGAVGIYIAKCIGAKNVILSDIDETSLKLANINANLNGVNDVKIVHSDGFNNISDTNFTLILSNPPYHTNFSLAKHFIEKGFNRLQLNGKFFMVVKRKDWYVNKISAIFGGAKVSQIDDYYVICAEKRNSQYANKTLDKTPNKKVDHKTKKAKKL
ncbi:MAG: methyltransferase [Firmicutes bacterium]|nr:methyltransferase [Bacillota bacterium]